MYIPPLLPSPLYWIRSVCVWDPSNPVLEYNGTMDVPPFSVVPSDASTVVTSPPSTDTEADPPRNSCAPYQ